MKTVIHFSNKQKALPWTQEKNESFVCFCVFECCRKTGVVRQIISESYLLLHLLRTGHPRGAITFWLIQARVKKGETSDPHARLNLQHHNGRGRDQPQSSSRHITFLSPLVKAATNHRQGDGLGLLCSTDPTGLSSGKIRLKSIIYSESNLADYKAIKLESQKGCIRPHLNLNMNNAEMIHTHQSG